MTCHIRFVPAAEILNRRWRREGTTAPYRRRGREWHLIVTFCLNSGSSAVMLSERIRAEAIVARSAAQEAHLDQAPDAERKTPEQAEPNQKERRIPGY